MRSTNLGIVSVIVSCMILLAQESSDQCQISSSDLAKMQKALEAGDDARPFIKTLTTFATKVEEEAVTTKHIVFPGSRKYITASVVYSDEAMGVISKNSTSVHDTSISLALVVSDKRQTSAFGLENNATAEMNYNENTLEVRVRKVARINGRLYAIGLECLCNGSKRSER